MNPLAIGAGLAGQYVGKTEMVTSKFPDLDPMYFEHLGVGLGVGAATMDIKAAALAAGLDHGLMVLYDQVPTLAPLDYVRGGIASAAALFISTNSTFL